ncbi:MAG: MucR family transcriptional regulator [Hyphomicrobiaceae bacterium]
MNDVSENSDLIENVADIVAAYVTHNTLVASELPGLINSVHQALATAAAKGVTPVVEAPTPAVPVKRSVTPDFIICLEDGKKFKSLKRHLRTHYDLSPEEYRAKWGLPHDYPMVAPNYAEARSRLAKSMGLGRKAGEREKPATTGGRGRRRATS